MSTEIPRNNEGHAVIKVFNPATGSYVEAIVDDEDWFETNQLSWYLDDEGYPASVVRKRGKRVPRVIRMHEFVYNRAIKRGYKF